MSMLSIYPSASTQIYLHLIERTEEPVVVSSTKFVGGYTASTVILVAMNKGPCNRPRVVGPGASLDFFWCGCSR